MSTVDVKELRDLATHMLNSGGVGHPDLAPERLVALSRGVLALLEDRRHQDRTAGCRCHQEEGDSPCPVHPNPDDVEASAPCWCHDCEDAALNGQPLIKQLRQRKFIVCPTCGNKRCPRAKSHNNGCTGSNAPGQPGSNYP